MLMVKLDKLYAKKTLQLLDVLGGGQDSILVA
jgi:hypothetical protein